ncbi:hypothetical protein Bca52824_089710 [Brassica carinata]|uniref:C2 domain-containing protein n=1 Tax=Brassica carinata TaxID=52824 RepID=A0A8X7TQ12_BRACI|nr:hypothetical protein Bca52824_089710 [Brassica carinata]
MVATSVVASTKKTIKIPLNCKDTTQKCPLNYPSRFEPAISSSETCPDYFKWIHQDLKVWQETGITRETLERAKPNAHFRLVIKSGRLYLHQYDKCYQTRDVFTIWGILQLLKMYPGQVPDLELLFLCHDQPGIWKKDFRREGPNSTWPPPPLFHYCSHRDAYDIVFPDWSFWGWPEVNVKEWTTLQVEIREANERVRWKDRVPYAHWKGNSYVSRKEETSCNVTSPIRLGEGEENGFKSSNLEDQCTHRYKIYIEGRAWSVSKKYILACDSMALLVKPEFFDFFGRSMVPMEHYWPIRPQESCRDLEFAVEWGNNNTEKAQEIGRRGSEYMMKRLEMKYVYDYMLYVLQGYGKLMRLNVTVPENATEVCSETMACPITDGGLIRQCMDDSLVTYPSVKAACDLPQPYGDDEIKRFLKSQESAERHVEKLTNDYWEVQNKILQKGKILRFDGQIVKTSTKLDDASPVWNEKFFFNISDTEDLSNLILEAYVYNKTSNGTRSCLGKIRILGTAFVPYSEAVGLHYPLEKEKWSVFSFGSTVRGELTLKVFVTDNPSVKIPTPNPIKKLASNTTLFSQPQTLSPQPHQPHTLSQQQMSSPQPSQPHTLSPQQQMITPQPPQLQTLSPQQQMITPQPPQPQALFSQPQALFLNTHGYGSCSISTGQIWFTVLGGVTSTNHHHAHDLVEPMEYLFVKIVKACNLPTMDPTESTTRGGEIMLSVWLVHKPAKHFQARRTSGALSVVNKSSVRSKVYHSPRLWYLRVNVIEAQDLVIVPDRTRFPPNPSREYQDSSECLFRRRLSVLDESTYNSSDFRPSMKKVRNRHGQSVGVLELGILGAEGLSLSRDGKKETVDAYCVAKYGTKWVRTRTVMNSLNPRFNEQYTWEVYEPATVITIGVFDNNGTNGGNNKDGKIGKVRVRISTLESGRLYTNSYPLLVLRPSGVKNMGELHLAIRFTCTSMFQMLLHYWKPLLPKMHYVRPLKVVQQEILRRHAVNLMAARLSRAEPPLRKEVIEYITDSNSHFWSIRKSRANLYRLRSVFSGLLGTGEWFQDICTWKKPVASTAVHVLYLAFVCLPEMILPIISLWLFMLGVWNYRLRPRQPQHMDTSLSFADNVHPEELTEEFDTFPFSSQDPGLLKSHDLALVKERVQALLSWRDPRATSIFMVVCLVSSVVLYVVPFKVFVLLCGLYIMRHPRLRRKTPPGLVNFFKRLPAKTDCML